MVIPAYSCLYPKRLCIWEHAPLAVRTEMSTGDCAEVREYESMRISDLRPCLHIRFIRLHQNTGDTSANCRISEPSRFSYFRTVARIFDAISERFPFSILNWYATFNQLKSWRGGAQKWPQKGTKFWRWARCLCLASWRSPFSLGTRL